MRWIFSWLLLRLDRIAFVWAAVINCNGPDRRVTITTMLRSKLKIDSCLSVCFWFATNEPNHRRSLAMLWLPVSMFLEILRYYLDTNLLYWGYKATILTRNIIYTFCVTAFFDLNYSVQSVSTHHHHHIKIFKIKNPLNSKSKLDDLPLG